MMVKPSSSTPILSRLFVVDEIPDHGLSVSVEATAAERDALASLNRLVALDALDGTFMLRRQGRTGVVVTGTVRATLTQTCVVSLEAFESKIEEAVDLHFLEAAPLDTWRAARAALTVEAAEADEEDEPDLIVDGQVDLGVVTAEHLTLGVDPYPKKPGVRFADVAPPEPPPEASPFAVLKALRSDDA